MPQSLFTPAGIFYARYLLKRKLPRVFLFSPRNIYALHFHAEQQPVSENCIELSSDGETLRIKYGYTDDDVASVIRTHEVIDAWLRKWGCGEFEYWYAKEKLPETIRAISQDGIHQVGTTRIAANARDGVVNHQLQVCDVPNLRRGRDREP